MLQLHPGQLFVDSLVQRGAAHSEQATTVTQEFLRGELLLEARVLWKVAQAFVHVLVVKRFPEQRARARVGPCQAQQNAKRRRLAGPVGPQQRVGVAAVDAEAQVLEHALATHEEAG